MNNYPKGYSALHKTMDYEPEIKQIKEQAVDTLKIHYFEEFIQLAKDKGVSLVCCISPSYKAPADDNKYESIKSLCKQYQVPFLYYGSDLDISCEKIYFQDRTHLNDCGARLFTSKLLSWIIDNLVVIN